VGKFSETGGFLAVGKMDEVKRQPGLVGKVQNTMEVSLKSVSKRIGQFAAPIDKPTKTLLSTFKQHGNPQGVPGRPGLDVDVCEFELICLQVIQPPMLLFIQLQCQFAAPVCSQCQFTTPNSNTNCTLRGDC
jgi:hypothetical protein